MEGGLRLASRDGDDGEGDAVLDGAGIAGSFSQQRVLSVRDEHLQACHSHPTDYYMLIDRIKARFAGVRWESSYLNALFKKKKKKKKKIVRFPASISDSSRR